MTATNMWSNFGGFRCSPPFKKGNGHLGKIAIDTLDSSMVKKTAADSKAKGNKPGSTCGLLG